MTAQDAYDAGLRRGIHDSQRVLTLDGHSLWVQFTPGAMPSEVPMDLMHRARWLEGYAAGIHRELIRQEIAGQAADWPQHVPEHSQCAHSAFDVTLAIAHVAAAPPGVP